MTTASAQPPGDGEAESAVSVPNQNAGRQEGSTTADPSRAIDGATAGRAGRVRALRKLRTWFLLAVFFAVIPTLGQHISGMQRTDYHSPGLLVLAARADLFVVSMGLAANALVQSYDRARSEALNFWGLVNVLVLAFTTYLAATSSGEGVSESRVGTQSLIILGITLVSAGRTTYLCERESTR